MKKKRFMRLVMSYGVQRNEAERMALNVGAVGSYEEFYANLRLALIFRPLARAFEKIYKAAADTARRAFDGIAAAFAGIDIASGADYGVIVHHTKSSNGGMSSVQTMTQEEHKAAHVAGRRG